MNTQENIDEILARHFSGEPLEPAEQAMLDAFIAGNGNEYSRLQQMMECLDGEIPQLDINTQSAWKRVEARLSQPRQATVVRRIYPLLAVAASLLLLLGVGMFAYRHILFGQEGQYANSHGESQEVELPDGTRMILAPHATAKYSEEGDGGGRKVRMTGKAFFDVIHDGSPFLVEAGSVRVGVLGTSFTVDARKPGQETVSVQTGRVMVSSKEADLVLTRGEKVTADGGKLKKTAAARRHQQRFVFSGIPIQEAVSKVEHDMDVKVELSPNVNHDNRVTTTISSSEPSEVLRELAMLCNCRLDSLSPICYRIVR
ncbi:MAG: FecR domain-containing protein [Prevotella sp.]|nr:FecR domain-containing protein [Prevotella sp.]